MKNNNIKSTKTKKIKLINFTIIGIMVVAWLCLSITPMVMFENSPVQLWVNLPSYADIDEKIEATVQAWDWSERLSKSYNGTVQFDIISYDLNTHKELTNVEATLPETTKFKGTNIDMGGIPPEWTNGDVGNMSFEMDIKTEGVHYLSVKDDMGFTAISNPVIVSDDINKRLLWGDIHTHSAVSDGSGFPGGLMKFAKDTALLDFYSLTDHGEGFGINTAERAQWQIDYNFNKTEKFNNPGNFVTFHGCEWTTSFGLLGNERAYGHYAVVSDGSEPVLVARGKQTDTEQLWDYLDTYCAENDAKVVAIPHHLTQTNFEMDWFGIDSEHVKTVSVFSVHGSSLLQPNDENDLLGNIHVHHDPTPGAAAIDAFKMGIKTAIVANSDSHDGHPGHPINHKASHYPDQYPIPSWTARYGHPYPGGLTGAYIDKDDFDRKGIMGSIRNGSVLGTRAPFRPIIDFSVNGTKPGDNSSTVNVENSQTERNININIMRDGLEMGWNGNAKMNKWEDLTIEVWKNSELWQTKTIDSPMADITVTDTEEITGTSYDDYYYNEEDGKYYQNERSIIPIDDPSQLNTNGEDYYFIRVYQGQGAKEDFYAWAGPVWVGVN